MESFRTTWTVVWNALRKTQSAPLQAPLQISTDMDWILNTLNELQGRFRTSTGSSSRSVLHEVGFQAPKKINDYIYEVYKPADGKRPSVEIVFFHGLQLEHRSLKDAHITTWVSRDKSELWLSWLSEDFPHSRILTVSYDAFLRRTSEQGRMEMFTTCENLLHSFTGYGAEIGQDGCPVVLVGHCLGGLVMKELCVQANSSLSLGPLDNSKERVETFLNNVRGVFTYATPHYGSRLADINTRYQKGPLFEDMEIHNKDTTRRNEMFRMLRKMKSWKTFGVGETLSVTLDSTLGSFNGIVVPEASARYDVDGFYSISADHFNVCRPVDKQCGAYRTLSDFVTDVLEKDEPRIRTKTDSGSEIVGVKASVDIIVKKLVGTPRLALVGFAGIGKTTLAKVVFDRISKDYEYVCFLDMVKSLMAHQGRAGGLRSEIVKGLKKGHRPVNSGSFNWNRLKGKKVLIVLDDAEIESHVMVMTELDCFSTESRVIVTSRDAGFLQPLDFEIHRVKALSLDDSKRLFCMHAFKQAMAPRSYEERVSRFAEKCGGFPLALRVTGSYLYKRKEGVWDDAMKKLSLAKPLDGKEQDELWYFLRISYDSLAHLEKQMFLDAATCFYGEKLRDVQEAWRCCSWASAAAESGWENLLDRCLVSKTRQKTKDISGRWYNEETYISMHEVLRDMGRAIAGNSRMVVDLLREARQFQRQLHTQDKAELKVLIINSEMDSNTSVLCDDFVLSGLEKLEILWLRDVNLSCVELQLQALRQLKVKHCVRSSRISLLKKFHVHQLQALESLEIVCGDRVPESHVHELSTDLTELAESVGEIGALRKLHIGAWPLRALPSTLGQLQNLEHLRICGCLSLTELPESVGQLGALQSLKIEWCTSLTTLPNNLRGLQALKMLHISCDDKLIALPESLSQLGALQELKIDCRALEVVPNLGQLGALKKLTFAMCEELTRLPESIGQLRSLTHLKICKCDSLEGLPNTFGKLDTLEELTIQFCDKLTVLPGSVGQLCALRRLTIDKCDSLKGLPNSIGELQALEELKVRHCWNLAIIPESIGQLRKLQTLHFVNCHVLEKFSITSGALPALETLRIRCCRQLVVFPESIAQLRALRRLDILFDLKNREYRFFVIDDDSDDSESYEKYIHPNQWRQLEVLKTLPDTLRELPSLEKVLINRSLGVLYRTTLPKSVEVNFEDFNWVQDLDSNSDDEPL